MKILVALLLISCGVSMAAPTIYGEQNFSIEYPGGWQKAEPPPKALALLRSPDGTKGIVVISFAASAADRGNALDRFVAGAKDAAAAKGIAITGEQDLLINGTTFHICTCTLPGNVGTFSASAAVEDQVYSVQGFSSTSDPASDPEIQGAIHSFRLLSPAVAEAPASVEVTKPGSAAHRAGELTGRIAIAAFAIGALVLIVRNRFKRKNAASQARSDRSRAGA